MFLQIPKSLKAAPRQLKHVFSLATLVVSLFHLSDINCHSEPLVISVSSIFFAPFCLLMLQ
ncbi:hypothetical protein BV22DRAFT_1042372 [Leucogyrophana mollusca]|uniref:Uncharacterized protein n=1 Tax=Leucogyrophana mollusca TaxID=85980 RepID=A0ACB8AW36_9AGAM|nr:hypothetical protein BV22DRAFT_1042372 [Leucogyrophana mollusca]